MSVLVTGASGFVGSWLVRRLLERGEDVRVLQRPSTALEAAGPRGGGPLVVCPGDITDPASLVGAVQDVDTVFHLAGVVGYSRAMRPLMERVNVEGTRNVVEAVAKSPRRPRLVYMSSVVAVGASFDGTPMNEDSTYNVGHLNLGYFETKRQAEEVVREACRKGRIEAIILNPSTIYGAGDAKKGSRKTQLKVARGELPFYTSGGVSVVSVHDVVDTVLRARERGRSGERYILSGENISIRELFQRIASGGGVRPPSVYLPNLAVHALGRLGDWRERHGKQGPLTSENAWTALLFHWFDHGKATRELEFRPRPATEALKESVDWMKSEGLLK